MPSRKRKLQTVTRKSVQTRLQAQKQAARARQAHTRAKAARDAYKPRKGDLGKLVLIGVKGQRNPQAKGRKGYLIYVTSTGKKQLQNIQGIKEPFKPRRLKEIELPLKKNLHKKVEQFQKSQRKLVKRGIVRQQDEIKRVVKKSTKLGLTGDTAALYQDYKLSGNGKGRKELKAGRKGSDFNNKVIKQIAKHLRATIKKQAAQRSFIISAIALIELPDGRKDVVEFQVPIARNDRDSIEIGGIENFVKHKFYAFMAQQLAFLGYVTSGSANHIRRLADNRGAKQDKLVDSRGELWVGNDLEVVKLLTLEWKIEQA